MNDNYLEKLKLLYNRFLTAVCRSEVMKTCRLVVSFLKMDNTNAWAIERVKYDKAKFDRKISSVISKDGQVNVSEKKTNRVFCEKIKDFVVGYSALTKEAISLSKEIDIKSH
jgi:hypothetical protein